MARQVKKAQIRKSTAKERFTDRNDPVKFFNEKYESVRNENGNVEVIHYYGEGGIGKSSLLNKIMNNQIEGKKEFVLIYSFRTTQDKARFMSTLARVIRAHISNADFTVFYYALNKYLEKCGMTDAQIEDWMTTSDQTGLIISETAKTAISLITDFLPIGGNTVGKVGELVVDSISRLISEVKKNGKREDKENIYKIEQSGKDELEKELQLYFATDCQKFMYDIKDPLVILLDDYEFMNDRVKHGNYQEDLWLCDEEDGLVNLIPNTLWVIAGRDRINWNEDVLPAENCHLLGTLGENDVKAFFEKALDPQGNTMDSDMISGLCKLTGGIPVYMDMCFGRFETGQCHKLEEFGKNTKDIAHRYFKDRDNEERIAIEFLCGLTGVWSDEMRQEVLKKIRDKSDKPYEVALQLKLQGIKEQTYVEKISDQYKIHDIYRKVVRDNMDKGEREMISNAAYEYLAERINDKKLAITYRVDALRQLIQEIEDFSLVNNNITDIILDNCIVFMDVGKYYEYNELAVKLVSVYKEIEELQPSQNNELKILSALMECANSFNLLGSYKDAFKYGKEVLEKRSEILGEDHPKTIAALTNISITYYNMGEYTKALQIQQGVMEKSIEIMGANHHDTIAAMNNLAATYSKLGEHNKALLLGTEVLEKRKEIMDEDHPDIIAAQNNLAISYLNVGKFDEALQLQQEVLEKRRDILGKDHPDTIIAQSNLAITYSLKGEQKKALQLKQEVLEKRKEILGEDHPDTIAAKKSLAITYSNIGESGKALQLNQEILEKYKKILREDSPNTIAIKSDLASAYSDMGEYDKALQLRLEVLEKHTEILGENHPTTLSDKSDLASTYSRIGEHGKALQLQQDVLEKCMEKFGENHRDTIIAKSNLAVTYSDMGQYEKALQLLTKIYEKHKNLEIKVVSEETLLKTINEIRKLLPGCV